MAVPRVLSKKQSDEKERWEEFRTRVFACGLLGYSRTTFDLDLLVRKEDRAAWQAVFHELGYSVFRETESFVQLAPPLKGMWPIDLMLVNETTFSGILADASETTFRGLRLNVPSLEHQFALKLHALKRALRIATPRSLVI